MGEDGDGGAKARVRAGSRNVIRLHAAALLERARGEGRLGSPLQGSLVFLLPAGAADATVMLAVLLAFALISLALNRRALMVSGLLTFGTALAVLVNQFGGGGINTLMYTALIIGASIVLLGGGWRTARRAILKVFPQQGAFGRIFPPEPA